MPGDGSYPPTASATAITLNLIVMGLGSGLLTMPWGVAGASIVTSLLLLAVVLALNIWTVMILVRASERWKEFDLGALLSQLPGKLGSRLQIMANSIIWASQFLVLLGYTIAVTDSLIALPAGMPPSCPLASWLSSRRFCACLMGTIVLPLSFLDQKYLASTSTLSIAANTYIVVLVLVYAFTRQHPEPNSTSAQDSLCMLGLEKGSVTQFSLLMYTIIIQMVVPQMYQELEGRSPEKFRLCLIIAFACLFVIFAVTMVSGYVAFGPQVYSNVMLDLPHDAWGHSARLAMAITLIGCYPLNVKPMTAPFLRAGTRGQGTPLLLEAGAAAASTRPRFLAAFWPTLVIVACVTTLSLWLHDLGPLNAINGSIQVIGYIGVIPGITGLYLLGNDDQKPSNISLYALIAFGVFTSALGIVTTDNNVLALERGCLIFW